MAFGMREIRKNILKKKNSFMLKDLYAEFNAKNSEERKLIIQTLNDMYSEGVVVYDKNLDTNCPKDAKYAFRVA